MASKPIIYQVLPRLFGNLTTPLIKGGGYTVNGSGKFDHFTDEVLTQLKELGISHIWFTGVIRHATTTSFEEYGLPSNHPQIVKGEAGSPYAITDYYDISPELATNPNNRMEEFRSLLSRVERQGIKSLIDFVPNHLSREYKSVAIPRGEVDFDANDYLYIDGTKFTSPSKREAAYPYTEEPARVTGNDCFSPSPLESDWYDTVKLNYNHKALWHKMKQILRYWIDMGVSGFRCDMVRMVPEEFWAWLIGSIKEESPETLFIGELYEPERYYNYLEICKFDYLYNKVGLYDTLVGVTKGELPTKTITNHWLSLGEVENRMLNFIENHDEVRAASSCFANDPYRALAPLTLSLFLNRAPFLLYFGQELGERGEENCRSSIFEYGAIPTIREWLVTQKEPLIRELYSILFNMASREPAIVEGMRYDLHYANQMNSSYNYYSNFSFARKEDNSLILFYIDFANLNGNASLILPEEMFDYFGISSGQTVEAVEAFGGDKLTITLHSNKVLEFGSFQFGVKIIKFLL